MDWDDFVKAISDLADIDRPVKFVMSEVDDYTLLELEGHVVVESEQGAGHRLQFWIQRPETKGGGFLITTQDFGGAEALHRGGQITALRMWLRRGAPIFQFEVCGDPHGGAAQA